MHYTLQLCTLRPTYTHHHVSTQVTVGFGDIVPTTQTETIFTIILIYLGVAFTTSAVANLTLLIGSLDAGSAAYVPSTKREKRVFL